jgi:hypothetical protein
MASLDVARQCHALREYLGPREKKLRLTDVKEIFVQMRGTRPDGDFVARKELQNRDKGQQSGDQQVMGWGPEGSDTIVAVGWR